MKNNEWRLISGLCLFLIFAACNSGNPFHPRPTGVLSSYQMIPLLVDIQLTDAALKLNMPSAQAGDVKLYYARAYAPVFKKHKTTPEAFDNSMNWYGHNIDKLDEIYTEVIVRLSTLESQNRIRVRPVKRKPGGYGPFYPEAAKPDSVYLPDTSSAVKIPYALPAK